MTSQNQWSCAQCTLFNKASNTKCSLCGGPNPARNEITTQLLLMGFNENEIRSALAHRGTDIESVIEYITNKEQRTLKKAIKASEQTKKQLICHNEDEMASVIKIIFDPRYKANDVSTKIATELMECYQQNNYDWIDIVDDFTHNSNIDNNLGIKFVLDTLHSNNIDMSGRTEKLYIWALLKRCKPINNLHTVFNINYLTKINLINQTTKLIVYGYCNNCIQKQTYLKILIPKSINDVIILYYDRKLSYIIKKESDRLYNIAKKHYDNGDIAKAFEFAQKSLNAFDTQTVRVRNLYNLIKKSYSSQILISKSNKIPPKISINVMYKNKLKIIILKCIPNENIYEYSVKLLREKIIDIYSNEGLNEKKEFSLQTKDGRMLHNDIDIINILNGYKDYLEVHVIVEKIDPTLLRDML